MVDRTREFYELLLPRIEKEPTLRPRMFIQFEKGYEHGESELDLTKMIKDDKIGKNPKGVRTKLSGNNVIPMRMS